MDYRHRKCIAFHTHTHMPLPPYHFPFLFQLPELIHSKEKGYHRWGLFCAANIGFFVSFIVLFIIAVYEEDLNNLVSE